MKRFENKVVVISGASRNTGVEIADLFIREGAKVCICASSEKSTLQGAEILRARGLNNFIAVACALIGYGFKQRGK